jgi:hypothetical protein
MRPKQTVEPYSINAQQREVYSTHTQMHFDRTCSKTRGWHTGREKPAWSRPDTPTAKRQGHAVFFMYAPFYPPQNAVTLHAQDTCRQQKRCNTAALHRRRCAGIATV